MTASEQTPVSAIELGRAFFEEVVKPAMARVCPEILAQAACGRFGLGSECIGMDDAVSRDHQWGPRVDILLPDDLYKKEGGRLLREVGKVLPAEFRGFKLESAHLGGEGLSPESLQHFMWRAIGRTTVPATLKDWLDIPEEDITHLINGEVWHDGSGEFTHVREFFEQYYPDAVWKRRIAHWCRYASGMGLYHIHRATLRDNLPFAFIAVGRTIQRSMELVFLLNRTYYPYDKWLYPMFKKLPELAPELDPLIEEAVQAGTTWPRRVALIEHVHMMIDERMVAIGLIDPHPKFVPSPTSGYRLLEYAYRELLTKVPDEIRTHVPLWDQKFLEEFHSGWVVSTTPEHWKKCLNLSTGQEA